MKQWYAVHTKSGWEKKLLLVLRKRKIEFVFPVSRSREIWSDSTGNLPLFPSCIFIKISRDQTEQVLQISGVISYLYWMDQPAVFPDGEIEMLESFLSRYPVVEIQKIPVQIGEASHIEENRADCFHQQIHLCLPCIGYVLSAKKQHARVQRLQKSQEVESTALNSLAHFSSYYKQ